MQRDKDDGGRLDKHYTPSTPGRDGNYEPDVPTDERRTPLPPPDDEPAADT